MTRLKPRLRLLLYPALALLAAGTIHTGAAAADAQLIAQGKAVYDAFCIYCHGVDGAASGPAAALSGVPTGDLSNQAYMSLLSNQDIYERIAYGEEKFPYLQMPGWRDSLDGDKIKAITAYVRTLAVNKGPLQGPTPAQRLERFQKDPLERGRIYYLRYCSHCHGASGNGDGPSAANLPNKPVAFSSPQVAAGLSYEKIRDYVSNTERPGLSAMPVFQPQFKDKVKEIHLYIKTLSR